MGASNLEANVMHAHFYVPVVVGIIAILIGL
jgi:hypothetical protein